MNGSSSAANGDNKQSDEEEPLLLEGQDASESPVMEEGLVLERTRLERIKAKLNIIYMDI